MLVLDELAIFLRGAWARIQVGHGAGMLIVGEAKDPVSSSNPQIQVGVQ